MLAHGLREKRALVCAGTLFVDDIAVEAIRSQNLDPAMLLAESAAAEKRLSYVGKLGVFDAMAGGGFVLGEYSEDLATLFDIGTEVDATERSTSSSRRCGTTWENPVEARAIATRATERVRRDHTIGHRLDAMMSAAGLT